MKHFKFLIMLLVAATLVFTACSDDGGSGTEEGIHVVFQSAVQVGSTSGSVDSTGLTLTFDIDPANLSADNMVLYSNHYSGLSFY